MNWLHTNSVRALVVIALISSQGAFASAGHAADAVVEGALQKWHKVTVKVEGPFAKETDTSPNPFIDYRMTVKFAHAVSGDSFEVPGYFAADGDAGESSAEEGNVWLAHLSPNQTGKWSYRVSFVQGEQSAIDPSAKSEAVEGVDGLTGTFEVAASDKSLPDFRAVGRLQYVGERYLRFADSGKSFLKIGADAPETLLAYKDFDNTIARKKKVPLKTWQPHVKDWQTGDPVWKDGKGKGLIGAINYLSSKGANAFSFLTYNAGGDGDNVWPFVERDNKLHYDCSKLDQWGIVFEHGTSKGMYLHFKMQETENDDNQAGHSAGKKGKVVECLDNGDLGIERKLYCRELIARFGHNLALNWNLGEENTQTTAQQKAMIRYIAETDPYDHLIVIHSFPSQQDKVYRPLIGGQSELTGTSLQNDRLETTHEQTVKWVTESTKAGKPWVVAFDESGSAAHAQCPDLGYEGFDGRDNTGKMVYTREKVRHQTLWGTLMGGGAGCEYYFGYRFAQNDLLCEDWRSRDKSWEDGKIAIDFFQKNEIPFTEMVNADELVGNPKRGPSQFCFAKKGDTYVIYQPNGKSISLDLTGDAGEFEVKWFDPRTGGPMVDGPVQTATGGEKIDLGEAPDSEDWVVLLRKKN